MAGEIVIKQGEALLLRLAFLSDEGAPLDLANATLTAQARSSLDALIADLPIVKTGEPSIATVTVADTSAWPAGVHRMDIRMVAGGLATLSETAALRINKAVTA